MDYYILTGINAVINGVRQHAPRHELIFGDYDRMTVACEKLAQYDYIKLSITKLEDDSEKTIQDHVAKLNQGLKT